MFKGTILETRKFTSKKGNPLQFASVLFEDPDNGKKTVGDLLIPVDLVLGDGEVVDFQLGKYGNQIIPVIVRNDNSKK